MTAKRKKATPLPAPIASIELVPLDLIDVQPQIRTEFDEESLQELAQDIQARGLLQPVLLNPHLDRYTLIAGERRLRACRLAGLASIPALLTKASAEDAEDMQLAENIQREELSLEDLAKAVRRLFDRLGNLQAVADRVKKSKPWVSKHLAVTCSNFSWRARALLQGGISEDLELLTVLSKLDAVNFQAAGDLAKGIEAGKAGRKEAQAALKKAKDEMKAAKLKNEAAESKAAKSLTRAPVAAPAFDLDDLLYALQDWMVDGTGDPLDAIKAEYASVWHILDCEMTSWWSAGVAARGKGIEAVAMASFIWSSMPAWLCHISDKPGTLPQHGAWVHGVGGRAYDLEEILQATRQLVVPLLKKNEAGYQVADLQAQASA